MSYGIKLHISGDFVCFTRPEMKVERVSYDVITPSAACGANAPVGSHFSRRVGVPPTSLM